MSVYAERDYWRERHNDDLETIRAMQDALDRIAENAEAWHGPPPDMGHVRALAVIAEWARSAARLDGSSGDE